MYITNYIDIYTTSKVVNQDDARVFISLRGWTRPPVPEAGDQMELDIFEAL